MNNFDNLKQSSDEVFVDFLCDACNDCDSCIASETCCVGHTGFFDKKEALDLRNLSLSELSRRLCMLRSGKTINEACQKCPVKSRCDLSSCANGYEDYLRDAVGSDFYKEELEEVNIYDFNETLRGIGMSIRDFI